MRFWDRLASIDRRMLYLLLALAVVLPLVLKFRAPIRVSDAVRDAYNAVESLPAGSKLLISIDYDPSSAPEVQPMLLSILRHSFRRGIRVIVIGQLPLGLPLAEIGLSQVAAEFNARADTHADSVIYGEDYINLGYRPGYTAMMVGIGRELRDYFSTDYKRVPMDSFPFMRSVHSYRDIGLLVTLAHGAVADFWIQYAGGRYGQSIIVGCTGVNAPNMYQYYNAGQIKGIIGGLQAASGYEALVGTPGSATLGMPAQSAGHGLIILLLIIGNLGYLLARKKARP